MYQNRKRTHQLTCTNTHTHKHTYARYCNAQARQAMRLSTRETSERTKGTKRKMEKTNGRIEGQRERGRGRVGEENKRKAKWRAEEKKTTLPSENVFDIYTCACTIFHTLTYAKILFAASICGVRVCVDIAFVFLSTPCKKCIHHKCDSNVGMYTCSFFLYLSFCRTKFTVWCALLPDRYCNVGIYSFSNDRRKTPCVSNQFRTLDTVHCTNLMCFACVPMSISFSLSLSLCFSSLFKSTLNVESRVHPSLSIAYQIDDE